MSWYSEPSILRGSPMAQPVSLLSSLFGDSLISPIKQHMSVCHEAVLLLTPFFEAVMAGSVEDARQVQEQICQREQEADAIKRRFRMHLPSGFLLSVSRDDLLELIRVQDKLANGCRDLAGLVYGRRIQIPAELRDELRECVAMAIDSVTSLNATLDKLDTLVGTGFVPSRTLALELGLQEVDNRERACDEIERRLCQSLFRIEALIDPIDTLFLYQVIELIGEVADRAKVVANRIRIIIAQ